MLNRLMSTATLHEKNENQGFYFIPSLWIETLQLPSKIVLAPSVYELLNCWSEDKRFRKTEENFTAHLMQLLVKFKEALLQHFRSGDPKRNRMPVEIRSLFAARTYSSNEEPPVVIYAHWEQQGDGEFRHVFKRE